MLAVKLSTGVALEVMLNNPLHASEKAIERLLLYLKARVAVTSSKQGYQWPHKKHCCSPPPPPAKKHLKVLLKHWIINLELTFYKEVFLDVTVTEEGRHDGVGCDADEEDKNHAEQHEGDPIPPRHLLTCEIQTQSMMHAYKHTHIHTHHLEEHNRNFGARCNKK